MQSRTSSLQQGQVSTIRTGCFTATSKSSTSVGLSFCLSESTLSNSTVRTMDAVSVGVEQVVSTLTLPISFWWPNREYIHTLKKVAPWALQPHSASRGYC